MVVSYDTGKYCRGKMPIRPHDAHVQAQLIGIGLICDTDCQVLFSKTEVNAFGPDGSPILRGWRDDAGAKLWCFALRPDKDDLPPRRADTQSSSLAAFSAYDLPSVAALVRYGSSATALTCRLKIDDRNQRC